MTITRPAWSPPAPSLGAGVGAEVLFPPAVMAVAILATQRYQAESCDLIIAVDSTRVRNSLDLVEGVQDIRAGCGLFDHRTPGPAQAGHGSRAVGFYASS